MLLKVADITTVVHELGHIFRRQIKGNDIRIIEDWTGVKDGKWERQHEEQFAKGFERYLTEGKAPSEELKTVFEKFKTWILDIYRKLIYDDIWRTNLNSEVRVVFDRLFVDAELPQFQSLFYWNMLSDTVEEPYEIWLLPVSILVLLEYALRPL